MGISYLSRIDLYKIEKCSSRRVRRYEKSLTKYRQSESDAPVPSLTDCKTMQHLCYKISVGRRETPGSRSEERRVGKEC